MFATFQNFVREASTALTPSIPPRFNTNGHTAQAPHEETDVASATTSNAEHDERPPDMDADAKAEKRRRDRRNNILHETFIVVRPPPSVSNHPLNLQLQLVPPSTRENHRQLQPVPRTSPAPSTETGQGEDNQMIRQRSMSMRSNRSNTSIYSSASFSTASIASSTSSSGRRIIPLYNLSAHNVMTNTVTDAGTDAKVAKFGKRGIEVIGLGVLECYEIIYLAIDPQTLAAHNILLPGLDNGKLSPPGEGRISMAESATSGAHSPTKAPSLITPSSSTSHLSESSTPHVTQTMLQTPGTPTPNTSAKKLFGKMFKRKDAGTPASPTTPTPNNASSSPTPSFFRSNKRAPALPTSSAQEIQHAKFASSSSTQDLATPTIAATAASSPGSLQPPTLGTQATLIYRTASTNAIIPPSVVNTITNPLKKTRSKASFQASEDGRSREPSSGLPEAVPDINVERVSPPVRRTCHSYEWVIRRWIKGADNGLFGIKESILSAKSAVFAELNIPEGGESGGMVEVRFEWVKGKGSRARAREKERERASRSEDGVIERPRSMYLGEQESELVGSPKPGRPVSMYVAPTTPDKRLEKRKSLSSSHGASPATNTTRTSSPGVRPSLESLRGASEGSGEHGSTEQNVPGTTVYKGKPKKHRRRASVSVREPEAMSDDEESDPEDSETPWTCTVIVCPPGTRGRVPGSKSAGNLGHGREMTSHSRIPTSASSKFPSTGAEPEKEKPAGVRLKVATMTPAPYHPKVVSHLKMPFPLPDVNISKMTTIDPRDKHMGSNDLILTMEEIKDIVCVTGLWLIVREGFGGLERRRPGDGWRIRS